MSEQRDMLTTAEVAERAGVTQEWIRYLAAEGRIQAQKIANRWFIPREAAEAYLREREAKAESD